MEQSITFQVKGSAKEPYTVEFYRDGDNLTVLCDCPAGSKGVQCKHRINLLSGDSKGVVSGRENLVHLPDLVKGTDVEITLNEYLASQKDIFKNPMAYKKLLNKAFND